MSKQRKLLPKNLNTIAGVLSLLVITAYVADLGLQPSRLFQPGNKSGQPGMAEQSADRIATDLQVERFDEQGKISHRFSSVRAEYFNQLKPIATDANYDSFDESELLLSEPSSKYNIIIKASEPVFKIYAGGQSIAQLNANTAITDTGSHRTELIGGVRLIDTGNDAMVLTEKLVLNTLSKQILTREEVKIFSPGSSTTANGLQGNLTDQRWKLMSNVKSVIKP